MFLTGYNQHKKSQMPDYDAKSIPILDDIIEIDVSDDIKDKHLNGRENESPAAEDNLNLHAEETALSVSETAEPQIGKIDDLDEEQAVIYQPAADATQAPEFTETQTEDINTFAYQAETEYATEQAEETESDLFNYQEEQSSSTFESAVSIDSDDSYHDADTQLVEQKTFATQPLVLETIVEDVVKQLMPDLEQQLRHLVKQALEDRLPDEFVAHPPPEKDNV